MQVVDPHIHLWELASGHQSWLAHPGVSFTGDGARLQHDYRLGDLLREAGDIEILKVVHVEAKADAPFAVDETRWLQSLADDPANHGLPQGIVAGIDLSRDDAADVLIAHLEYRNVRGVRQILNVHADPLYDYVGQHYMHEPIWQRNFGLLGQRGLSFDLQLYPMQMADAARLARQHPETQLILNHAGMFVDRNHVDGWRAWRDGMRLLAGCPNVAVKISGLAMFDHHWTVESLRPYVLETIDCFGAERCMFASNFPVDRLFAKYEELWHAYAAIVAGHSESERAGLFVGNAERFYRI